MFINMKHFVYFMETLLFGKNSKAKLIKYVLNHLYEKFSVREIGRKLKINPAQVSITLNKLRKNNVIKNNRLSITNPLVKSLKIFFNTIELLNKGVVKIIASEFKKELESLIVYGSWAKGTNNYDSDVDLFLKIKRKVSEERIALLSKRLADSLDAEVHLLVLTEDKLSSLKKKDPFFYSAMINGILLWGEPFEI